MRPGPSPGRAPCPPRASTRLPNSFFTAARISQRVGNRERDLDHIDAALERPRTLVSCSPEAPKDRDDARLQNTFEIFNAGHESANLVAECDPIN